MSDDPEAAYERAAIHHLTRRLYLFTRGLGLDEATTRLIVEKVYAEMPVHTDEEPQAAAATSKPCALSPRTWAGCRYCLHAHASASYRSFCEASGRLSMMFIRLMFAVLRVVLPCEPNCSP